MLPLTPHQKLSQNKIAGLSIAWGRAAWAQLEDGSYGYVFPEGALQLANTLADFEEKGLTLDALMACLDQFEAELGSALDTRQRYGMLRNHGYACPGLVVRSEDDDRVVCVMTPASWEYEATEAYFEWFFDEKYTTISTFDTLAGVGEEMVDDVPLDVPYYESACQIVAGIESLSESRKEAFLQRVWDYHKNTMPGLKPAAKKSIVTEWKGYLAAVKTEQFAKQGEGCKNYDKEQDVCLDKDIAEPANEEDEGDEVAEGLEIGEPTNESLAELFDELKGTTFMVKKNFGNMKADEIIEIDPHQYDGDLDFDMELRGYSSRNGKDTWNLYALCSGLSNGTVVAFNQSDDAEDPKLTKDLVAKFDNAEAEQEEMDDALSGDEDLDESVKKKTA